MTVDQVLAIAGRLDDTPGLDTPRERVRRVLLERMTDAQLARVVIQECQHTAGEQNRRALQDAVILAGKCLGFRAIFGRYHHDPGAAPISGEWESRRRLRVLVSVCTAPIPTVEIDALAAAVRDGNGTDDASATPRIGLCITTPFFAGKSRLEETVRAASHSSLRLISLKGVLRLADLVAAGRLTHDSVLQVLNPVVDLDAAIDLFDESPAMPRASAPTAPGRDMPAPDRPADTGPTAVGHWIVGVRLDSATSSADFVESALVAHRLLRITIASNVRRRIEPGDSLCVCVAGVGLVAHARASDIADDHGHAGDARCTQIVRLGGVIVYPTPVIPPSEVVRRLELGVGAGTAIVATPLAREEFDLITRAAVSGHRYAAVPR